MVGLPLEEAAGRRLQESELYLPRNGEGDGKWFGYTWAVVNDADETRFLLTNTVGFYQLAHLNAL